MNPIRLVKSAFAAIKDPNRDFIERVFLILALVSEVTLMIAFVVDLITWENQSETLFVGLVLVLVPAYILISLRFNKLKLAIRIVMFLLVVAILPILFFFGGGLEGGGFMWFIFAFMYIGLVLRGKWRFIMFAVLTLLGFGCYFTAYTHPELVFKHSREMFYVDSFVSLILVGILCFVMTWAQGLIFTEENERAKKEAERAEELTVAQNRFFSSMSHEIRTPINSILGLNELILRDQSASDEIIRDASGIQGSGKMLLSLINDILDFSKIEAGSMDIVPVDYKVGDMMSEIVNMMWLRAHDKGLGFEVSIDPEVPTVLYGDEVRIKQVIINLLNNAVKYTSEGHVGLRVESNKTGDDTIDLCVSISDTGMGIKKEDMPYLFDAFKRIDEGKNRHIEGTGLGLSIVKQLIDLMKGSISVNSVYGEGSTFTFTISQMVTDHNGVGDLNIHSQHVSRKGIYEASFIAPEARILIVDDNEMNLEVESRLLRDTDMRIDKAVSGKEALEMCLKAHYDAIFMDHLMPGMDGIECLSSLRNQSGGLNRNTPVIVLTANAGSSNRELYNQAGFDGYLVKPVSGAAMEDMLVHHISAEKIIHRNAMKVAGEDISTTDKYAEKASVVITSSSMCDLPDSVIRKLHIPIIPFVVKTDEGEFRDGVHLDAYELIRHISAGKEAVSSPPNENDYTEFFAHALKKAHHLIHISITTSMSKDYYAASEAARSFDNVTVINSGCLSSATGLLVLIGCKQAQQGMQVEDIVSELEMMKQRLRCSFIINTTDYMVKKGLISRNLHRIAESLSLHPAIKIRGDKAGLGGIWAGRTQRAYRKYISKALPVDSIPDSEVVFVTYADLPSDTLAWIEEEIKKTAFFEHVVFQQASAAITSNCGPGSFGILYFLKSNKSYNISSYIDDMTGSTDPEDTFYGQDDIEPDREDERSEALIIQEEEPEHKWYQGIAGIDGAAAIKNSGSEEAFKSVLKIFYESIPNKHEELENLYSSSDWDNYTIRIHALKSSARLVGALGLGDMAERLENAGKEKDIQYISDNHANAMEEYLKYKKTLAVVFPDDNDTSDGDSDNRPIADKELMSDFYEGIRVAADAMDCDMIEDIIKEMEEYRIPDPEKDRFKRIKERADAFDYDGILNELS